MYMNEQTITDLIALDTLKTTESTRMISTCENIEFYIYQTNDFWIRDNGPIFVYDNNSNFTQKLLNDSIKETVLDFI